MDSNMTNNQDTAFHILRTEIRNAFDSFSGRPNADIKIDIEDWLDNAQRRKEISEKFTWNDMQDIAEIISVNLAATKEKQKEEKIASIDLPALIEEIQKALCSSAGEKEEDFTGDKCEASINGKHSFCDCGEPSDIFCDTCGKIPKKNIKKV